MLVGYYCLLCLWLVAWVCFWLSIVVLLLLVVALLLVNLTILALLLEIASFAIFGIVYVCVALVVVWILLNSVGVYVFARYLDDSGFAVFIMFDVYVWWWCWMLTCKGCVCSFVFLLLLVWVYCCDSWVVG